MTTKQKRYVSYRQQLFDPRWQRKRLEILDRDGFSCQDCGATDKTLHVHHLFYESGAKAWEYPDESLIALCKDCHQVAEERRGRFNRLVGMASEEVPLDMLYGLVAAFVALQLPFSDAIEISSYEVAVGVGFVFGWTPEQVIDAAKERDGASVLVVRQSLKDTMTLTAEAARTAAAERVEK